MKVLIVGLLLSFSIAASAWDQTGHRIIGKIAENHLSEKTKKKIQELLGSETLAQVSTWADFIKADPKWKTSFVFHYISIPHNKSLKTMFHVPEGDVLTSIENFTKVLVNPKTSKEEKGEALKFLVHLIGDVHQPLHVGKVGDEGGGLLFVKWFERRRNIHEVWDTGIIDTQNLSYTEYVEFLDHASKIDIKKWQGDLPSDWAQESFELRNMINDEIQKMKRKDLSYEYVYRHLETVNKRLLMGGIRLAGWLNSHLEGEDYARK